MVYQIITPISPKKNTYYLGGLLYWFYYSFCILYILKILDTKINTREDLEKGLPGLIYIRVRCLLMKTISENDDRSNYCRIYACDSIEYEFFIESK